MLTLFTTIGSSVITIKQRQWSWLAGLVLGFLVPIPVGFILSQPLLQAYGPYAWQPFIMIGAGMILTPVALLVYSWHSPRVAVSETSLPQLQLPVVQPTFRTDA